MTATDEKHVTFFFRISRKQQPKLTASFEVITDVTVAAWHVDIELSSKKIFMLLGSENKGDLWSKFESLLSHLTWYHKTSCDDVGNIDYCGVLKKYYENLTLSNFHKLNRIWPWTE